MLSKHTHIHAHSLIPSSHLYTCATRFAITHAPSSSRVLHCSTFTPREPERRRAHWAGTLTLTHAQKGTSRGDMHTWNACICTKCMLIYTYTGKAACTYANLQNYTKMCSWQYAGVILCKKIGEKTSEGFQTRLHLAHQSKQTMQIEKC